MLKQTLAALIASLGLSAAALAQTGVAQTAPPAPTSDEIAKALAARTCPLPEIVDQVKLQPVSGSDLMTVPVTVNDTTKQFLLDVALGKPSLVSPQMMAKLSLPEIPKNGGAVGLPTSTGGGANFSQTAFGGFGMPYYDVGSGMGSWLLETHVRVRSFGVGNATARHLQFQVADKGLIGRSAAYEGYLTGDFFRQYDVELDFAGRKITWLTPSKCTDPDQAVFWAHHEVAVIPVTLAKDGRYQMQAMAGGHLINAEIDTSSPHTVMRRDIAEQDVGLVADKNMAPLGDMKDGMGMQIYVSNFPEIVFAGGGVTAENVPVLIQDFSMIPALDRPTHLRGVPTAGERIPDLAIGMDVLQHLHMYMVPGVGRIYVTAAE